MRIAAMAAVCALLACAGVIDARERRLPNGLAIALAVAAALGTWLGWGAGALLRNAGASLAVCAALVAFEVVWRRRGTPGQGMGDIKALFAIMLMAPVPGALAYAAALLMLAAVGLLLRVPALPLLPFLALAFPVALIACGV